jgi:hypothetical protein
VGTGELMGWLVVCSMLGTDSTGCSTPAELEETTSEATGVEAEYSKSAELEGTTSEAMGVETAGTKVEAGYSFVKVAAGAFSLKAETDTVASGLSSETTSEVASGLSLERASEVASGLPLETASEVASGLPLERTTEVASGLSLERTMEETERDSTSDDVASGLSLDTTEELERTAEEDTDPGQLP